MLNRLFKRKATAPLSRQEAEAAKQRADRLIEQGQPLEDRGELEAALALYRAAIEAVPTYARTHMNVAHVLAELKRWDEAEMAHRKAVECAPDFAPARFNLGLFLMALGKVNEAERQFLTATRLQPTLVEASIMLADLYETLDRLDDAEAQFKKATTITPAHPGAFLNFGIFCLARGRLEEASELFARAKALAPGFKDAESAVLFALNFRADLSAETIATRHRAIGALISRDAVQRFKSWPNTVERERRLRVGYVSGDFFVHPVGMFLQPVLANHRSDVVESYCYSNYHRYNPVAESLRAKSDHWIEVHNLSDVQLIERIRRDEIDILVDLSGHTNRNRLHVFAPHPAPVQITWLGYLNTTGLEAMDYRICDRHTDPPGATEALYTEKLLRMPDSQWCYSPWCSVETIMQPHADRADAIVFGSFNQLAKINDVCLDAWGRILAALPEANLRIMDVRQPASGKRLLERLAHYGVRSDRVQLGGRESIELYYRAVGNADVALDTFPYNGATTTLDALWMGVPVVALRGERSIARGAYSILKTLAADDLIATSVDQYVEINVRLARDATWRSHLRSTLRERLETSPLMDAPKFVLALEQQYRESWRIWCESQHG